MLSARVAAPRRAVSELEQQKVALDEGRTPAWLWLGWLLACQWSSSFVGEKPSLSGDLGWPGSPGCSQRW